MQESGEISRMKIKWWKEKRGGGKCSGVSTSRMREKGKFTAYKKMKKITLELSRSRVSIEGAINNEESTRNISTHKNENILSQH